jgi:hypothetical protein
MACASSTLSTQLISLDDWLDWNQQIVCRLERSVSRAVSQCGPQCSHLFLHSYRGVLGPPSCTRIHAFVFVKGPVWEQSLKTSRQPIASSRFTLNFSARSRAVNYTRTESSAEQTRLGFSHRSQFHLTVS